MGQSIGVFDTHVTRTIFESLLLQQEVIRLIKYDNAWLWLWWLFAWLEQSMHYNNINILLLSDYWGSQIYQKLKKNMVIILTSLWAGKMSYTTLEYSTAASTLQVQSVLLMGAKGIKPGALPFEKTSNSSVALLTFSSAGLRSRTITVLCECGNAMICWDQMDHKSVKTTNDMNWYTWCNGSTTCSFISQFEVDWCKIFITYASC